MSGDDPFDDPFDEIERAFDLLGRQFDTGEPDVPADVIDAGDAFEVRIDLPGFDADDIEVTVSDERTLRVEAEREETTADEFVTRERRRRASRSVTLPGPVDEAGTAATYDAGVLTVRLPRADGDEGTEIPVE
ncbi:MAG: Hsp20/alpha crystallin family protein [Haloarculaceae archaeon]